MKKKNKKKMVSNQLNRIGKGIYALVIIGVIVFGLWGFYRAFAYTDATWAPPTNNVAAPINTSSNHQDKGGTDKSALTLGGQNICLKDGTNCPSTASTSGKKFYKAAGTYPFTAPMGVTKVWVTMSGAGGGGGGGGKATGSGCGSVTGGGGGGGGGGGQALMAEEYTVVGGQNYTITVGSGGSGGAIPNGAGGNGGTSSFSTLLAPGGGGGGGGGTGGCSQGGAPGAGGASGGIAGVSGQAGDNGEVDGDGLSNGNGLYGDGGAGGGNLFSVGGSGGSGATRPWNIIPATQGTSGIAGGGGGGGGGASPSHNNEAAGGNGLSGFVIVEW